MRSVRELVYLSELKLQQFVLARPRHWWKRAQLEGEVKLPGIGGLKVGTGAPDPNEKLTPDLDAVVSALETSDRAAKWFADDAVRPGQWVHFDLPLCYIPLSGGKLGRAVVFLGSDTPAATGRTAHTTRLLLHGSTEHLLTGTIEPPTISDSSRKPVRYTELRVFAGLLSRLNRRPATSDDEPDPEAVMLLGETIIGMEVPKVIDLLEDLLEPHLTAAWMAGHARVTAVLPGQDSTTVIATPLYVEYAPPFEDH